MECGSTRRTLVVTPRNSLDAFLDALFALLESLDCVGEHRAVEFDLHFDVVGLFSRVRMS